METLEKTFNVPSNGYFGGPKTITLRAMTTREEKILYTAKDFNFLERLIKSCCDACPVDFLYLDIVTL